MQRYICALGAAIALTIAVPASAGTVTPSPATDISAQSVTIEGTGVGVRVGKDRHRRWESKRWRHRKARRDCRTVTVQERRPNGTTVTRTKTRC